MKKPPSKVAHNRPLIFFQYWPGCPNQPRIDFSYYKYVPRLICLLICAEQLFAKWLNSMYVWWLTQQRIWFWMKYIAPILYGKVQRAELTCHVIRVTLRWFKEIWIFAPIQQEAKHDQEKISAEQKWKVCWQSPAMFCLLTHQAKILMFSTCYRSVTSLGLYLIKSLGLYAYISKKAYLPESSRYLLNSWKYEW